MTDDQRTETNWKAPYLPYFTLTNFIDKKLGANPLPPRIDRGFVDNYAGSIQFMLLGTLRTMNLITEGGEITEELEAAVESPERRQDIFKAWAEDFYADQLELATRNATAQMLFESFAKHGYTGSTLRKAIVFFLSLVDEVDLPKSPHFRAPKAVLAPSKKGAKRPVKKVAKRQASRIDREENEESVRTGSGERKRVTLGNAGTVTIDVDVKWLELDENTFTKLRKIVSDLTALGYVEAPSGDEAADDEEDDES